MIYRQKLLTDWENKHRIDRSSSWDQCYPTAPFAACSPGKRTWEETESFLPTPSHDIRCCGTAKHLGCAHTAPDFAPSQLLQKLSPVLAGDQDRL